MVRVNVTQTFWKVRQPVTNRQAVANRCLNFCLLSVFIPNQSPLNRKPVRPVTSVYGQLRCFQLLVASPLQTGCGTCVTGFLLKHWKKATVPRCQNGPFHIIHFENVVSKTSAICLDINVLNVPMNTHSPPLNTNKPVDFIMGINPFKLFLSWPVGVEVARYLVNKKVTPSLSIARQLKDSNNHLTKAGNTCKQSFRTSGIGP